MEIKITEKCFIYSYYFNNELYPPCLVQVCRAGRCFGRTPACGINVTLISKQKPGYYKMFYNNQVTGMHRSGDLREISGLSAIRDPGTHKFKWFEKSASKRAKKYFEKRFNFNNWNETEDPTDINW